MKLDIIQIPALLSKNELKKFGDFIRSPYFNTEPRFIKVYEIIATARDNLSRELIAKKIFGNDSSAGDVRFRKLVSEFMKLFERFLAEMEFSIDTLNQKFMVLEKLKKMNLRKEFLKQADDIIDYIENETIKDELYYKNMTDVYAKKYSVEEVNFKDYKKDLCFILNEYTDKYFAAMKIFLFQRFATLEYVFDVNLEKSKTFKNVVLDYINFNINTIKERDPEIYLRYLALKLQIEVFDTGTYNEYLSVLEQISKDYKINEYVYYSTLINLISGYINQGVKGLEEKLIEIGNLVKEKELFKIDGIDIIDLKIFTETAITIGEYDWAISFTNSVKEYILHENKENVFKLIIGKIYFFKKDYGNAKILLSSISVNDYIHYIEAKLIECRIEFEFENYNTVLDIASTAKKFVKLHNDIGKNFSTAYNMFLGILIRLIRIIESEKNEINFIYELNRIERDITGNEAPIYAQTWLIEKIKKIKKGKS